MGHVDALLSHLKAPLVSCSWRICVRGHGRDTFLQICRSTLLKFKIALGGHYEKDFLYHRGLADLSGLHEHEQHTRVGDHDQQTMLGSTSPGSTRHTVLWWNLQLFRKNGIHRYPQRIPLCCGWNNLRPQLLDGWDRHSGSLGRNLGLSRRHQQLKRVALVSSLQSSIRTLATGAFSF